MNTPTKYRRALVGAQRRVKLDEHEYIVTAYAKPASGPGWANKPLWVVIGNKETGKFREDCIQPMEQTAGMVELYDFSALAHERMTNLVERIASKPNRTN
jgi:hypothetical protein